MAAPERGGPPGDGAGVWTEAETAPSGEDAELPGETATKKHKKKN